MCPAFKVLVRDASAHRERGEIHLTKATARSPCKQWAIVLRTIWAMAQMAHSDPNVRTVRHVLGQHPRTVRRPRTER